MNREILYRGQTRKYGEKVNLKGEKLPSKWVYGGICQGKNRSVIYGGEFEDVANKHVVYSETVGQFTGFYDKDLNKIFEGDLIEFLGDIYEVCFSDGGFGLCSDDIIDYEKLEYQIEPLTGCNNKPCFLCIDNFVSLLELYWNYNCEEKYLPFLKIIGNIYDNKG